MVGIPGKSRGCNTCRRRKVKCDEGRPACEKCIKGKRVCEGYERYPVFINRSQDGLQKRKHLDEARPTSPFQVSSSEPSTSLIRAVDSTAMDMQAYTGYFICTLLPVGTCKPSRWSSFESYRQIFMHPTQSEVLNLSINALAETTFGRHMGNIEVFKHGRQLYGQSLKLLQQAIQDPLQSQSDETLAAVRMMMAYESYEATTTDATAWHNHIIGLGAMVKARGPSKHTSVISRHVLEDLKQPMMIHAVTTRKRCFLTEDIWQEVTKPNAQFDPTHEIINFGFQIAALLEDADHLAQSERKSMSTAMTLSFGLVDLQQKIDNFTTLLLQRQGTTTNCEICGVVPQVILDETANDYTELHIAPMAPCDFFLHLAVLYGLMVMVAAPLQGVYKEIKQQAPFTPEQRAQVEFWASMARQNILGRRIMQLSEHFLHQELGVLYSRSAILPLQCARWAVIEDKVQSARCLALLEILTKQRHIPFAKQVNVGYEHVSHYGKKSLSQQTC